MEACDIIERSTRMEALLQPQNQASSTAVQDAGEVPVPPDPEAREGDQVFVLVVGFTIGMLIAGVFLVYIVLAAADLLK